MGGERKVLLQKKQLNIKWDDEENGSSLSSETLVATAAEDWRPFERAATSQMTKRISWLQISKQKISPHAVLAHFATNP